MSTGLSLFLSTPTFALRSEEKEDGCGPVDEGWNSCWREEKLPSKFRKMTKKAFVINSNKRLFTQLFKYFFIKHHELGVKVVDCRSLNCN